MVSSTKAKKEASVVTFISAGIGLIKNEIPLVAFWYQDGVQLFGSSKVSEWFKQLDEEWKNSLELALMSDITNISENMIILGT